MVNKSLYEHQKLRETNKKQSWEILYWTKGIQMLELAWELAKILDQFSDPHWSCFWCWADLWSLLRSELNEIVKDKSEIVITCRSLLLKRSVDTSAPLNAGRDSIYILGAHIYTHIHTELLSLYTTLQNLYR